LKRVFIVEDERIVATALQCQLENLEYEVAANVGSGEAALAKLESCTPDIILMDINLAGELDGIETAGEIAVKHQIPVVFLTAYSDDVTVERARTVGPYGFLTKPVRERDLKPAVEMALSRREIEAERDQLLDELKQAADEIEQLRKLLPVCAWCHRTRTEEGYWEELVGYLTKRIGASITHGICDACGEEHFEESI
jgi:DNA-binding NarL/FixJ family response regulator